MIKLETVEDIELLKELVSTLGGPNSKIDESKIIEIKETQEKILEEVSYLSQKISLLESIFSNKKVEKIQKPKEEKPERRCRLKKDDDFIPYLNAQDEYQSLSLKGTKIIHTFINRGAEREVELPINVFELLSIIERFKKGNDSIKVKEVNKFCKMFGLNKSQFSKIYYNLLSGKFDGVVSDMDKMIAQSMFSFEHNYIYRNDHSTGIDIKSFRELVSIYANSHSPLCAACKLIHERNDIDAFDLFTVLRKSGVISKIIEGSS